ELGGQPSPLGAAGVAADIGVATVLVAHVVVVQADDAHATSGEGVPQPALQRIGAVVGDGEVGLVGAVADRAVAQLVLVVAGGGHPGAVTRGAAVVLEPVRPGADPVRRDVGIAQIAVDQVEQRRDALHPGDDVTGRWAAEVVVDVGGAA